MAVKKSVVVLCRGFICWLRQCINPSSAVQRTVVLICKGLRILNPRFLHYIFDRILNGAALLG